MIARVAMGTETDGTFRVTVNDKIIVHLLEYTRFVDRPEVPKDITQQGISEIVGARRSHISLALSTLKERGLVEERTVRVTDEVRRKKGYFLTSKGYENSKSLAERYRNRSVRVEDAGGVKVIKIADLPELLGDKFYLVDILCCISKDGTLDIAQLTGQKPEGAAAVEEVEKPERKMPEMRAVAICPSCGIGVEFPYDNEAVITVVCGSCGNTFKASVGSPVFTPQTFAQSQTPVLTEKQERTSQKNGFYALLAGFTITGFVSLMMLTPLLYVSCGLLVLSYIAFGLLLGYATLTLGKAQHRGQIAFSMILLFAAPVFIFSYRLGYFWIGLHFAGTFTLAAAIANIMIASFRWKLTVVGALAAATSLLPALESWGALLGFGTLVACGSMMTAVLSESKVKDERDKDLLVAAGLFTAFGVISFAHWMVLPAWDVTAVVRIAVVAATLYVFAIFAKPISREMRAEIASVLGFFFIALGISMGVAPNLAGWSSDLAAYVILLGGGAVYISLRLHKPDYIWSRVCFGLGLFVIATVALLLYTIWLSLSSLWMAALCLWLVVGIVLCLLRFGEKTSERIVAVRAGAIAAIGTSILLAGVYMLTLGFGVEGAAELALGVPILGYAMLRSGAPWAPRLAMNVLLVTTVAVTWFAFVAELL